MEKRHTRVIVMNYSEGAIPVHNSKEDQKEWYAALGRLVAYGLFYRPNGAEGDTMQYLSLWLGGDPVEIHAYYDGPITREGEETYYGSQYEKANLALVELSERLSNSEGRFIIGAIPYPGGKWGFHS